MNRHFPAILALTLATAGRLAASGTNMSASPVPAPAKPALVAPATASPVSHRLDKTDANAAPAEADAAPAPVKADGKMDFQSFHLILDRNIFDMSRSGGSIRHAPIHQVKVDDFTLIGTMSYEKGQFAFFDGSSSEYQQARKPLESIANFKITAIGSDYVNLVSANSSNVIRMAVGTTIRREDNGPWSAPEVRSETTFADTASPSSDREERSNREERSSRDYRSSRGSRGERGSRGQRSSSTDATTAPTPDQNPDASSGGSDEDVIKRLMQKRAKEVKDDQ